MAENEPTEEPTESVDDAGPAEPLDDRAKFREALARKSGGGGRGGSSGPGGSKIDGTHAAAKASRTFRRKSGG